MPETVLVVEDDRANSLLIETIMNRVGGFGVITSDDGDEVLRLVESGTIAAVLMDVWLKNTRVEGTKVDGVELTRRVRGLEKGARLPILLLTAHAMRGDREALLFSSGANDYVAKPIVNQVEFVELVRRHIRAARALTDEPDTVP
jgi:two-component system, cell cycle response regulator DivK